MKRVVSGRWYVVSPDRFGFVVRLTPGARSIAATGSTYHLPPTTYHLLAPQGATVR